MFFLTQDVRLKYLITFVLFAKMAETRIYLKPIEPTPMDTNEVVDEINYMFVILPHDLLRSELPDSPYLEPYRTLSEDFNRNNSTNSDVIEGLQLNKTQAEMLRKSWRDSCDKRAAKICRKACISTYKVVCSAYLCKKSMKRSFKRECKRNCRARFVSSQRDSE